MTKTDCRIALTELLSDRASCGDGRPGLRAKTGDDTCVAWRHQRTASNRLFGKGLGKLGDQRVEPVGFVDEKGVTGVLEDFHLCSRTVFL